MLRICPTCNHQGETKICPHDGLPMVDAAKYGDGATHPLIGRVFEERYKIGRLLGKGGMGWVFEATNLKTSQSVALKVMRKAADADLNRVKRFYAEARMSSLLTQPHTVRVFDFGSSDDGYLYISMERLEGRPLSDLMAECGPLEPRRVAKLLQQICYALQEAHTLGLIHRDMKPENVFLCGVHSDPEFVKVVDFGVAKALEDGSEDEISRITTTGTTVGTPAYMAPEQATLGELDGRSDLYALGVLAYEALSGHVPFEYDSAFNVLIAHINEEPAALPSVINDVVIPEELRQLVSELLAKTKEERPTCAMEVAERLEPFVQGLGPVGGPQGTGRRIAAMKGQGSRSKKRPIFREIALPALAFVVLTVGGIWALQPTDIGPTSPAADASQTGVVWTLGSALDAGSEEAVPMDVRAFEADPGPTLAALARQAPEAFSSQAYLRKVNSKQGAYRHCGKRFLASAPTGSLIKVKLTLTIGPKGVVEKVRVVGSRYHTPEFEKCLKRETRRLQFRPSGAQVSVSVNLELMMTR